MGRNIYLYLLLILGVMVVSACLGGGQEQAPVQTTAPATTPGPIGSEIFRVNCQPCHAVNGAGIGLPNQPDFRNASFWASKSDSELINTIRNGRGQMPGWTHRLTDEEIKAVLKFEKTFAK